MKWIWLMAFFVLAAVAVGVDSTLPTGQVLYNVGGSEPAPSEDLSPYSNFYDNSGKSNDDGGTIQYMVSGSEPQSLVVNGQSTPFDSNNVPMNSYWIQGTSSWTQYIKCPMYARFKLLAYTQGGQATVREEYPDGKEVKKDFQFYPGYTRQTFTADAVGRHVIGFEINGQLSNAVIVDVVPQGSQAGVPNLPGTVQNPIGSSGQNTATTKASAGNSGQKNDPGI
jgi:hypothetical protein